MLRAYGDVLYECDITISHQAGAPRSLCRDVPEKSLVAMTLYSIAASGTLGRKLIKALRIGDWSDPEASRVGGLDGTAAVRTDRSGMGDYRAVAAQQTTGRGAGG